MSDWQIQPADSVDPAALHAAFGEAFADYLIGPFQLAFEAWPAFLARQAVDLSLSRVAVGPGGVLAFAFVAARPACRRWRLATMGARPAARGSGAAAALLDDFIARARDGGQAAVELEVFAQNERARRLYEGRGFVVRHELFGYRLAAGEAGEAGAGDGVNAPVQEVECADALDWLRATEARIDELPLQVTATVLAALAQPWQAWRQGAAQLVFSVADSGAIVLHSLIDASPDQADAAALLRSLHSKYAASEIRVPQLQRHELGGRALEAQGFERLPLHQLWLRRELARA